MKTQFKRPNFLFLFFILLFSNLYSQNISNNIDSLVYSLNAMPDDSYKVNQLLKIHNFYQKNNAVLAKEYADKMIIIAEKAQYYYGQGIANICLGNAEEINGNYLESRNYYLKAIDIGVKYTLPKLVANAYDNIGISYSKQSNFLKGNEFFLKAATIKESINNKKGLASTYVNIGIMYRKQKQYNVALEYFHKSYQIQDEFKDTMRMAIALINIGTIYEELNKLDTALNYFKKSAEFRKEQNDLHGLAATYINIGSVLIRLEKYSYAEKYYLKALQIEIEYGDQLTLGNIYKGLAKVLFYQKKYTDVVKYLEKAEKIYNIVKSKDGRVEIYMLKSQIYREQNNFESAYQYQNLYIKLNDSIYNEQSTQSIAEMQTKYETEKKEKEIEMLTKDNELQALKTRQQDDQIKKQWLLIIAIVFVLGLAFSLMYVIYSQFKFKKAANEELELKNRTVEEINKELDKKNKSVADSINYAQRIQETIMPTQNQLQKLFPQSFIFYKAKDVISGDFPWVWSSNGSNEGIYVSAVDCTGHGVPGAMMSMIGYFLLNEIVNDRKIHQPSEILNHLHEGIKQTLRQEENLESQDGMDIALCNIRKNQMEVQYAGAHRPMLLLHNGEIIELKGNRFPIGGLQYSSRGKEIKFTNHILKLEKGDSIYFYSDGLVDQISSQSGKRFKNDQVKSILLENQNKSMQEIHDIMNAEFIKWMGNEKQLDDVLMVGIRM